MADFGLYMNDKGEIEKENVKKIIPYGDGFLMVDKVLKLDESRVIAQKETKANDPVFHDHFRDFPIYPGALIVEGLGQTASILIRSKIEHHEEKDILAYLINSARFKKPVFPGSMMKFDITLKRMDPQRAQCEAKAIVGDETIAECDMTVAIVNKKEFRGAYGR